MSVQSASAPAGTAAARTTAATAGAPAEATAAPAGTTTGTAEAAGAPGCSAAAGRTTAAKAAEAARPSGTAETTRSAARGTRGRWGTPPGTRRARAIGNHGTEKAPAPPVGCAGHINGAPAGCGHDNSEQNENDNQPDDNIAEAEAAAGRLIDVGRRHRLLHTAAGRNSRNRSPTALQTRRALRQNSCARLHRSRRLQSLLQDNSTANRQWYRL